MRNLKRKIAVLFLLLLVMTFSFSTYAAPINTAAASLAQKLFLELADGSSIQLVKAEGGYPYSDDVVTVALSGESSRTYAKNLGITGFHPIRLELSATAVNSTLIDWISSSMNGTFIRKDGAVVTADYTGKVKKRLRFTDAWIDEVTFPGYDSGSKDACNLKLSLSIGSSEMEIGAGSPAAIPLPANTRAIDMKAPTVAFGGITGKILRVDPFTFSVETVERNTSGNNTRDIIQIVPGRIHSPDVKIWLSESNLESLIPWYWDFIAEGNTGEENRKSMVISYPNGAGGRLFRLSLTGMGAFDLEGAQNSIGDQINRYGMQLFSENIGISK